MDPLRDVATLARRLGIDFDRLHQLPSTTGSVVWLEPSPVAAKATRDAPAAHRELAASVTLERGGAPVVGPAAGLDPVVHDVDGWSVTFWRYVPAAATSGTWAAEVGASLAELHRRMARLRGKLDVAAEPDDVGAVLHRLDDPGFAPALAAPDRRMLRDALAGGRPLLRGHGTVVHGSPHPGNVLVEDGRPVFIDLATICHGPVEWDLAHLPAQVAAGYAPGHDPSTLQRCRILVSAVTAAWCWEALDRGPDMPRHARRHLAVVRAAEGR